MQKLLLKKGSKFLSLFFILFFSQITNAQLCFTGPNSYGASLNPYSIASGDFNSDGKLDLVTTNFGGGDISVLFGNGLGSFGSPSNFPVGMNPTGIVSTDFNGDGKLDLAVSNTNLFDNSITVLMGNGLGSFSTSVNFTTANNPQSLVSSDFNGDGKKDLAVAIEVYSVNVVSLYLGNGLGNFGPASNFSVALCPISINNSDFNNDGKMDLVTANYGANNISVLLGNGLGSFAPAVNYPVWLAPYFVESADFNGDGSIDLAVANYSSASVSVLMGSGTGTFAPAVTFTVGAQPFSISSADFNGDGKIDMAVALYGSNSVKVLLGNGLGSFIPAATYSIGTGPSRVISPDLNGDGKKDLAITNCVTTYFSVLLNNGPIVTANATSTSVCVGGTVILTGGGANSYSWSGGVTNGVPFTVTTTATYTVTGTNTITGCSYSALITIQANAPALAVSGVTTICLGNSTSLTASGANTYTWSNGPNTSSVSLSPTVTTTYSVSGTNLNGCSSTKTVGIIVNINPTISVASNPSIICSGHSSTLTVNGANTYSWNTGSTSSLIVVSPSVSSSYTVIGINNGCLPTTQSIGITVNASPILTTTASSSILCAGQTVTLTTLGANNYSWSTGAITSSVSVSPSVTTTYSVIGTNLNGCFVTKTISIVVNSTPTLSTVSIPSIVCLGQNATLSVNGANTYSWNNGSLSASLIVSPTISTTYTVVGVNNGCLPVTKTISIQVNPIPTISIVPSLTTMCIGETTSLTSSGANSYSWNTGATNSIIIVSPTITTTYSVTGVALNGCSNTFTFILTVDVCAGVNQIFPYDFKIAVYPNPNNGSFKLQVDDEILNGELILINSIGQKVFYQKITQGANDLRTNGLSIGIYNCILFLDNRQIHCGKISIE